MKFLKNLIKSVHDIENENSLLIHGLCGCNLDCFGCHNKKELVDNIPTEYYSEKDIVDIVGENGYFFDNIIFSGGEITLYGDKLVNFLLKIKKIYNGKIIIYTNGTSPRIINEIIDIIDGVYVDIKYNISKEDEFDICGVNHNKKDMINTLNIVYKNNKGFSGFRTIKYPCYDDIYLKEMNECIKNNYPNIEYLQNTFEDYK